VPSLNTGAGQYDWWNRQHEVPASTGTFEARKESCRLRGLAHNALFQVRLVSTDPELTSREVRTLLAGVYPEAATALVGERRLCLIRLAWQAPCA
jgi:hypothetical protein